MINKIFKNRFFLFLVQIFTLIIFVFLIFGAIGVTTSDKDFAKILRNTNFANLIVWSYWWPLIIASAIIFGRFWCSICPVELITFFFSKIGFRKKPNKLFKSGWIITFLYAFILIIGIHTLSIHRIPEYMAFYMIFLFAVAIIVSFIWEKRTFCTYVCPIGHLLGLYSLLSYTKLRVKNKDVCRNCKTKDCISKSNHYNFIGRSCTSELFPETLANNKNCILCGQCYKSCSKNNIVIKKRFFAEDLFTNLKLSWAEISFFIIMSGFVIYEILSEWKVSKEIVMTIPNFINNNFNINGSFKGTAKALLLFIIIPTLFYLFVAFAKKIFAKESIKHSFNQLVIILLPITASMHLLKALLKTSSRIPYWEFVFSDMKGIKTAQLITENPMFLSKNILDLISPFIDFTALLLSVVGIILSLLIISKQKSINNTSKIISVLTVIAYSGIFLITVIAWRFF